MTDVPPRLVPLLAQFDFGLTRLANRIAGPRVDSGDGSEIDVVPMTDDEYLWEPVTGCWSVRRRDAGPGFRATLLAGAGDWGRDASPWPQPWPPPITTIAWRLSHLSEMLTLRADYTNGSHALTRDAYRSSGEVTAAMTAFDDAGSAWRSALLSCDEAALDTVGYCTYPYGSDVEETFIEIAWWVNQEVLHHGAEIALLRDLYRARHT